MKSITLGIYWWYWFGIYWINEIYFWTIVCLSFWITYFTAIMMLQSNATAFFKSQRPVLISRKLLALMQSVKCSPFSRGLPYFTFWCKLSLVQLRQFICWKAILHWHKSLLIKIVGSGFAFIFLLYGIFILVTCFCASWYLHTVTTDT